MHTKPFIAMLNNNINWSNWGNPCFQAFRNVTADLVVKHYVGLITGKMVQKTPCRIQIVRLLVNNLFLQNRVL